MQMDTLPLGAQRYFRSPVFSTIPRGQRREHTLRPDVWSRIRVLAGAMRVVTANPKRNAILRPGDLLDVEPGLAHHLEAVGTALSFVIHLYRVSPDTTRSDVARWENEGGRAQQ